MDARGASREVPLTEAGVLELLWERFSRFQHSASKLITLMMFSAPTLMVRQRTGTLLLSVCLAALVAHAPAWAQDGSSAVRPAPQLVLWSDPGDIKSRDLFYGPAGKKHLPPLPVRFTREDREGGSPKFDVVDASGKKWRAKLGPEAQPETVAVRLLWAVGYIANENYFFRDLVVEGLPDLHRGQEFVHPGGHVINVRLQSHPAGKHKGKREGYWDWRNNPFTGTRELNGLRVMMALISNWDLVNHNTAIREGKDGEMLYEVSDVGASFGKTGRGYTDATSKNDPVAFRNSKFIAKVTSDYVDFNFPTHPPLLYVFDLKLFWQLTRPRWIGHHIPRSDVRWIASLLAQLSPQQIRDAFRAAGYTPQQVETFSAALESRIASLVGL